MSRKLLFLSCLILVLSAPSFAYEGQDLFGEYYIMVGEPTINGIISPGEWDNANWLPLDQLYYMDPPDLSNAKWAALWSPQNNLIYVVVTGVDTDHVFCDGFLDRTYWNKCDHVEVHIDANNSDMDPYQLVWNEQGEEIGNDYAQQWMTGNDNNDGFWCVLPPECDYPENPLDDEYRPQVATTINGDILTYEFAFKPYESFGWLSGRETKTLQLEADLQVGLDVVMCSKSSVTFGMLCENAWDGTEDFDGDGEPDGIVTHTKWNLASRFLDHWLILDLNQAWRPRPANKAVDMPTEVTLQWNAGKNAATHNVYFGDDFDSVNNADESSTGIYRGNQPLEDTTYTPAEIPLELNKTYYWRIDEVNDSNLWPGAVWHFKTVGLNIAPIANAGPDQTVYAWYDGTAEATLDGSGSYDPDEDELTYTWFLNSQVIATGAGPTISLPVGEHTIELIVNDGLDDSEPNEVVITVEPAVEAVLEMIPGVLNCRKQGEYVKARLTLPEGYLPEDVDVNSPVVLEPTGIESAYVEAGLDKQELVVVEAGFDRPALCKELTADGDEFLEITATGHLTSGQCFYGTSTIEIKQ